MTRWWFQEPWNGLWLSHHIGNGIIIPTDELIFFRGAETTNIHQPVWFLWAYVWMAFSETHMKQSCMLRLFLLDFTTIHGGSKHHDTFLQLSGMACGFDHHLYVFMCSCLITNTSRDMVVEWNGTTIWNSHDFSMSRMFEWVAANVRFSFGLPKGIPQ